MQAVRHLGGQADIVAWVARVSFDPFVTCEIVADGLIVVTEHAQGSIRRSVIRRGANVPPQSKPRFDVERLQ